MEIRETRKQIEIKGRKFIINKFDPFFGSYIALKVFKVREGDKGEDEVGKLLSILMEEDQKKFEVTQKRVLSYCSEILASGEVPVINNENNIAIINFTAPMAMNLFIQTIMFSMSDFFELGEMENLPQQDTQGSLNL